MKSVLSVPTPSGPIPRARPFCTGPLAANVAAFDAPASIVDNIKTGLVDIAIAQHPAEIGYFGVVAAYANLTGQSVPTLIGTGFTVMDKSNIDQPEVARFIYKE
jgi:ribose transport system substrate-binding protein